MGDERSRPLSYKAAKSCEEAQEPECRCRCKGLLHGARRGSILDLPAGDPHSMLVQCKVCKGQNTKCRNCNGTGWDLTDSAKRGFVQDEMEEV